MRIVLVCFLLTLGLAHAGRTPWIFEEYSYTRCCIAAKFETPLDTVGFALDYFAPSLVSILQRLAKDIYPEGMTLVSWLDKWNQVGRDDPNYFYYGCCAVWDSEMMLFTVVLVCFIYIVTVEVAIPLSALFIRSFLEKPAKYKNL